jgi:hypothetical protein
MANIDYEEHTRWADSMARELKMYLCDDDDVNEYNILRQPRRVLKQICINKDSNIDRKFLNCFNEAIIGHPIHVKLNAQQEDKLYERLNRYKFLTL